MSAPDPYDLGARAVAATIYRGRRDIAGDRVGWDQLTDSDKVLPRQRGPLLGEQMYATGSYDPQAAGRWSAYDDARACLGDALRGTP